MKSDLTPERQNAVWDAICFLGSTGTFTTKQAEQLLQREGFKPKTAQLYFNRFVQYAMANPADFSGPKSRLVKIWTGVYKLEDNNAE